MKLAKPSWVNTMKSVVCSSLSAGAVVDIRSTLGHDEGSARKLMGTGCSGESTKIGVYQVIV